jgi:hypothetical protein
LPRWAAGLRLVRERSVWETHAAEVSAPFVLLGPARGVPAATRAALAQLHRDGGESWRSKARRSGAALRDARLRRSDHMPARRAS